MSVFWRFAGGGLVVLAAMLASRAYSDYAKRRLLQYSGLIALFSHTEGMILRFLSSGEGIWRGFSNEELERVGLLPLLREGESLKSAFLKCEGGLALSKGAIERIKDFLSSHGRGYREGEVSSLSTFRRQLEEEMKSEEIALDKSVKVARALLIGGALAFLIMII